MNDIDVSKKFISYLDKKFSNKRGRKLNNISLVNTFMLNNCICDINIRIMLENIYEAYVKDSEMMRLEETN